jgi:hypothetical protein
VIARRDEDAHLLAARDALAVGRRADDRAHLGGHHVAVGVHWQEQRSPLEREAHAAPRGRSARCRPQAQGLALELEQLFRVDLAPLTLDTLEHPSLERREALDLGGELGRVTEHVPRILERQRDRGRRRSPEVVRGDGARRLERRLGEQGPHTARILPLPGPELQEIGGR